MSFLNTVKNALHNERQHRGSRGQTLVPTRALIDLVECFERIESRQRLDHDHKPPDDAPSQLLQESLIASYLAAKDEGYLFLFIMDVLKPLIEDRRKMDRAKRAESFNEKESKGRASSVKEL